MSASSAKRTEALRCLPPVAARPRARSLRVVELAERTPPVVAAPQANDAAPAARQVSAADLALIDELVERFVRLTVTPARQAAPEG